ncbi:MAG: hypothetical protein Kow0062_16290 [Acidobacteriota bacterium]
MTQARALVLAGGLALAAPALPAGGPVAPDRPTFSPGTVAVERGRIQLEAGASWGRDGAARVLALGEALVRAGIYESIELRLGAASWVDVDAPGGDASGITDPIAGVKLELVDYSYRWRPESALVVETTVPVGSTEVGDEGWQPGAGLVLGWEAGPRTALGAFVGATRARAGGERFTRGFAAVSVSRAVTDDAGLFAELRAVDGGPGAGAAWHLLAGASRGVGDDLALDAWVEQRLDGRGPRYRLGVGLTRRWSRPQSGSGRSTSSRSSVISRQAHSGPSRPAPERLTPP